MKYTKHLVFAIIVIAMFVLGYFLNNADILKSEDDFKSRIISNYNLSEDYNIKLIYRFSLFSSGVISKDTGVIVPPLEGITKDLISLYEISTKDKFHLMYVAIVSIPIDETKSKFSKLYKPSEPTNDILDFTYYNAFLVLNTECKSILTTNKKDNNLIDSTVVNEYPFLYNFGFEGVSGVRIQFQNENNEDIR